MTPAAARFLGPATLEALTGAPVQTDVLDPRMGHVALHEWADVFVVSPATANTIARLAAGLASDPVSALFLSFGGAKPVLVAPAMHDTMWAHPATRANVERLRGWGVSFVGPAAGPLAAGGAGEGRMSEPDEIVRALDALLR